MSSARAAVGPHGVGSDVTVELHRRHSITLDLTPTTLTLQLQPRLAASIRVHVDGETAALHAGHSYRFDLRDRAAAPAG